MKGFNPLVRIPGFLTLLYSNAIWRFDKKERLIYLTFDDGPVPEITPWVLDVLKSYNIKATFFCVGENVMKYPEVYIKIIQEGHSVGNHTFSHLVGLYNNNDEFYSNIKKAAGYIDSDLFRPPHGMLKLSQYQHLKNHFRIIMWDVVTGDYNRKLDPEKVFANVCEYARPGSVITFHDSEKAAANLMKALPKTIKWLIENGYSFESIKYNKINNNRPSKILAT